MLALCQIKSLQHWLNNHFDTSHNRRGTLSHYQYLEGNLFKNAEAIYDLLKKHIAFSSNFDKTLWQRTDGFLYPMSALREGVMW